MATGFELRLDALIKNAEASVDRVVRQVAMEVLARVVMKTPVGNPDIWKANATVSLMRSAHNSFVDTLNAEAAATGGKRLRRASKRTREKLYPLKAGKGYVGGRARGGWQAGVGSMPTGDTGRIDPSGREAIAAGAAVIEGWPAQGVLWIANSVPYIGRLEYGHSKQAPAGMVRATFAEMPGVIRRVVREESKNGR